MATGPYKWAFTIGLVAYLRHVTSKNTNKHNIHINMHMYTRFISSNFNDNFGLLYKIRDLVR